MQNAILQIEGSIGEGGGQMLRTSLTMSAVTGQPFEMVNIRAKRAVPGLKRQHLTCVRAVAKMCNAEVTGDDVQSMAITFKPGPIRGGDYHFDIGTAGSVTLVAQTVLPILLFADQPSTVRITGGTHVPMSPAWEFFAHTYLPQLHAMGANVTATLHQHGFYPAGGGVIELNVHPWTSAKPLYLVERGPEQTPIITAKVAHLPRSIAADETLIIARQLASPSLLQGVEEVASQGPGNYALVSCPYKNIAMTFTEIGTHNKSRKAVANTIAQQAKKYLRSAHVANEYLSDQLLLPIVLAGRCLEKETPLWGTFSMPLKHSLHFDTNVLVLKQFMPTCEIVEKNHLLCKHSSILSIGKKGLENEMGNL